MRNNALDFGPADITFLQYSSSGEDVIVATMYAPIGYAEAILRR